LQALLLRKFKTRAICIFHEKINKAVEEMVQGRIQRIEAKDNDMG
jgi:hypothetical protein